MQPDVSLSESPSALAADSDRVLIGRITNVEADTDGSWGSKPIAELYFGVFDVSIESTLRGEASDSFRVRLPIPGPSCPADAYDRSLPEGGVAVVLFTSDAGVASDGSSFSDVYPDGFYFINDDGTVSPLLEGFRLPTDWAGVHTLDDLVSAVRQ
jgi:hypothetical protein